MKAIEELTMNGSIRHHFIQLTASLVSCLSFSFITFPFRSFHMLHWGLTPEK